MTTTTTEPSTSAEPAGPATTAQGSKWLTSITVTLAILVGLSAWLALFIGPLSALKEGHSQSVLYSLFRGELASGQTPPPPFAPGRHLRAGEPVAILSIPAISMSRSVVVEGTRSGDLESGPGHLPGSVLPGEAGRSEILGRAFGFGGPFASLTSLRAGDLVNATTGQGVYTFQVVDVRGPGQPIPASVENAASALTLVTATNQGWSHLWVPDHAVYVDAIRSASHGAPVAPGTVRYTADEAMQGDSSALMPLVLWLELLLVAGAVVTLLSFKWHRAGAWLVGVPVIIAVLWGASLQFAQLLPNLL